ncbi:hypothetical protein B0H11DRAFT_2209910 [Mycena galericulata]|nr:hypothetical protein B0H11DRAFT_2209910 [Mycena galericulata]
MPVGPNQRYPSLHVTFAVYATRPLGSKSFWHPTESNYRNRSILSRKPACTKSGFPRANRGTHSERNPWAGNTWTHRISPLPHASGLGPATPFLSSCNVRGICEPGSFWGANNRHANEHASTTTSPQPSSEISSSAFVRSTTPNHAWLIRLGSEPFA